MLRRDARNMLEFFLFRQDIRGSRMLSGGLQIPPNYMLRKTRSSVCILMSATSLLFPVILTRKTGRISLD